MNSKYIERIIAWVFRVGFRPQVGAHKPQVEMEYNY